MNTITNNSVNPNLPKRTILIIDDNPTNLGVISDYLEGYNFRILVARNGKNGLKRAEYVQPDLILLDVMMPGIDGFETCKRLKANKITKDIPVIFMTALTRIENKVKGFNAGAVDYVTKPLQHQEVLARITTHLSIRDLTQSLQTQNLHLEISNEVGRQITSILDLNTLLNKVTKLIQTKFGYYFVGVCLLTDKKDILVLQASTNHQEENFPKAGLHIPMEASNNNIAWVCQTKKSYLVNDVRNDEKHLSLKVLPDTGSELSLPLQIGSEIIGVLDIQSDKLDAFGLEDITVLEGLANQIAIAINNAKLYDENSQLINHLEQKVEERTEALNIAYNNLERLDKAKSDFIQVTAHELRTPMTIIDGYTQLLETDPIIAQNEDTLSLLEAILNGSKRMSSIINGMLDVISIDNDVLQLNKKSISLTNIIETIHQDFQPDLKERKLTISLNNIDKLPLIYADNNLLHKVFYNLIINAIKYTPDGGKINITGQQITAVGEASMVEIIIEDTGIGIDPEHLELIFEKLYQTSKGAFHSSGKTSYKGGGPGLGLAIAKGIVTTHGGKIWAESEKHDEVNFPGSKFFVRLPINEEQK